MFIERYENLAEITYLVFVIFTGVVVFQAYRFRQNQKEQDKYAIFSFFFTNAEINDMFTFATKKKENSSKTGSR